MESRQTGGGRKAPVTISVHLLRLLEQLCDLRALRMGEVRQVIRDTPRPFGRAVDVVWDNELLDRPSLEAGQGLLIGCRTATGGHAVSLFRCLDGHYLYYDSFGEPPCEPVSAFMERVSSDRPVVIKLRLQHNALLTCAYHALAFLDFASRTSLRSPKELFPAFLKSIVPQPDVAVVQSVKRLLQEFDNDIELRYGKNPSLDKHIIHTSWLKLIKEALRKEQPEATQTRQSQSMAR